MIDFTVFIGSSVRTLLMEWVLDGSFIRFALVAVIPLLYCVSLVRIYFFSLDVLYLTSTSSSHYRSCRTLA